MEELDYTREEFDQMPWFNDSHVVVGTVLTCSSPDCKCFHRIFEIHSDEPDKFRIKQLKGSPFNKNWTSATNIKGLRVVKEGSHGNPLMDHFRSLT